MMMIDTTSNKHVESVTSHHSGGSDVKKPESWSTLELLIFIQEVFCREDWSGVCEGMKWHPLTQKYAELFTEELCISMYKQLVEGVATEGTSPFFEGMNDEQDNSGLCRTSDILKISRTLFQKRIDELNQELTQRNQYLEILSEAPRILEPNEGSDVHVTNYLEAVKRQRDFILASSENSRLISGLNEICELSGLLNPMEVSNVESPELIVSSSPIKSDSVKHDISSTGPITVDVTDKSDMLLDHEIPDVKKSSEKTSVEYDLADTHASRSIPPAEMSKSIESKISRHEKQSAEVFSDSKDGETPEDNDQEWKLWRKRILFFLRDVSDYRYASVFLHPVKEDEAEGYYRVVKRPMDLTKIRKRVEEGVVTTTLEVERDLNLMFTNAMMYNKSDHEIYMMAKEMKTAIDFMIQAYKAAEKETIEPSRKSLSERSSTESDQGALYSVKIEDSDISTRRSLRKSQTPVSSPSFDSLSDRPEPQRTLKRRRA